MRHAMQVQIGALTSTAGWQSQAWAMQNIGIDLFAEAKEASSCQVRPAVTLHAYCGGNCTPFFLYLFSVSLTSLLAYSLASLFACSVTRPLTHSPVFMVNTFTCSLTLSLMRMRTQPSMIHSVIHEHNY